jgi:tetratricopeptide (TPR) repeat protein
MTQREAERMHKSTNDAAARAEFNRLLDAVLDLPGAQREQWLDTLGPEFDGFKPRLRALLSHANGVETDDFLSTLPKLHIGADDPTPGAEQSEQAGDQVGPYRLIRELGGGGMGTVWLAERTDGLINRAVALKLPHGAWKRAALAERMAREREILATLNHPNIARLYDAGLTADGQPYLALEYVEGRTIDAYCRDQRLDPQACLGLFAQVANAVAYAHGKLIIHRDLKPANILVTADSQARLLDFGIAKLLAGGHATATKLTELSGRALTPDYASPEQILGEPLTIASDVYSLGVILYELLSGTRPYKLKRDSRGALEDAILQAEPALPSAVADRPRSKALRGDLDTIVMKALKKKPEERYATVHALLDDVERYLGERPVLARPDSAWYRVRRFMARNKLGVGVASGVTTAILIGAAVAVWQANVAIAQKSRAEEVNEFIAAVFREADPTQEKGKVLSAPELLRQAEHRLYERADADPAMQVELLAIIGESLFGLQENVDSARVVEQALRLQASAGVDNDLLKGRLHLALSRAYEYLGRDDDALREIERSVSVLTGAGHTDSAIFARAKLQQSALGLVSGNYEVAEGAAHEAIRVASATLGAKSSEVATGLQQLSHVYTLTQRRELAVDPARQAFNLMLELHGQNRAHPRVMESSQYYATALTVVGDFDAASVLVRAAADSAAAAFGENSWSVGELLSTGLATEIERGDLRVAIADARRSIEIYLSQAEPGSVTHAGRVRKLGAALLAARSGEALERLREAHQLAQGASADLEVLHARGSFALALAYRGRFDEAEDQLHQVLDHAGSIGARGRALAMKNLGVSLRLRGQPGKAIEWLEKAVAAASVHRGHRGDLAHAQLEAGLARLELDDVQGAQEYFDRAERIFSDVHGPRTTPARADLFVGGARVQMHRANYAAALPLLEKADSFWRDFDPENRWAGEAALWLGRCYLALGRGADAHPTLRRAEKILARSAIPADAKLLMLAQQSRE